VSDVPKNKALVVTKEEDLGTRIVEYLEHLGYECARARAGTTEARDEVQQLLFTTRFDLIITQQRMSPYSAADLLRDVETMDGTGVPGVVCLADDESYQDTFRRQGGSSFQVPEAGGLLQALEKGLREAMEHRASQKASKATALGFIDSLQSEDKFQKFIERIFRELEYSAVRVTHGRFERARSIVCFERNRMRQPEYVGVQIKMGNIDGNGGTSGMTELRRQANEAFGIKVPFDDGEHDLDKVVIVASGSINEDARHKLSELLLSDHFHRRIYFLDREAIADLVVTSCPAVLAGLE
jgi:CheY-like chemotaxis protein